MLKSYEQIKNAAQCETIIEKSKFICKIEFAADETAARRAIDETRKSHPFATHNCYAYIVNNGEISRFSDDGEPQGTAGQPMLEVLKNKGLVNVVAVVTRYFGGIKLGTGGLCRAYSGAVVAGIEKSGTITLFLSDIFEFKFAYDKYAPFLRFCQNSGITVLSSDFCETVTVRAAVKKPSESLLNGIIDATDGKIETTILGEGYYE